MSELRQPSSNSRSVSTSEGLLLAFGVFICWLHYRTTLSAQPLAGWDLTSHFYLLTKMLDFLSQGHTSGYDFNWYAGIPLFKLYPPLFYIMVGAPTLLSGGLILPRIAFHFSLLALLVSFVVSTWWMTRAMFGRAYGAAGILGAILFVTLPRETAHFAVGALGLYSIGLPSSYLALTFFALLIGALEHMRGRGFALWQLLASFLIAAMVLSHILVSIFMLVTLLCYLVFRTEVPRARVVALIALGALLSSWWWLPFLQYLPYSSGTSLGLPGAQPDPLLVFFPGIFSKELFSFLTTELRFIAVPGLGSLPVPAFLLLFPWHGAIFLAGTVIGLACLIRERSLFWALFYLGAVIILPRTLLTEMTSLGLHTYRFVQPLFLLQIAICAYGLGYVVEVLRGYGRIPKHLCAAFLGLSLCSTSFLTFTSQPAGQQFKDPSRERVVTDLVSRLHVEDYPEGRDASQVLKFIRDYKPQGRVACDTSEALFRRFGSPHYFTSEIPIQLGLPAVPGLLAESALSSGFINSTLYRLSKVPGWTDYMLWGRNYLVGMGAFRNDSTDSMIERLGLYGVELIVAALPSSQEVLSASTLVEPLLKQGNITVYRIKNFLPLIAESTYKPFQFIEKGGMKFREFAEQWYSTEEVLDSPVIFDPSNPQSDSRADADNIGGYIVSWGARNQPTQSDFTYWHSLRKPVLFLNTAPHADTPLFEQIFFFPQFSPWAEQKRFAEIFRNLGSKDPVAWQALVGSHISDRRISLESRATVLLNFSYAPGWGSMNANQTVYWASPSSMLIFGKGPVELTYR